MAHFAELDENNVILRVCVVDNKYVPEDKHIDGEKWCENFWGGRWKQTSYNHNFRKHYCGPGYKYDKDLDVFIAPKPFNSWSLNNNMDWTPPVPYPIIIKSSNKENIDIIKIPNESPYIITLSKENLYIADDIILETKTDTIFITTSIFSTLTNNNTPDNLSNFNTNDEETLELKSGEFIIDYLNSLIRFSSSQANEMATINYDIFYCVHWDEENLRWINYEEVNNEDKIWDAENLIWINK